MRRTAAFLIVFALVATAYVAAEPPAPQASHRIGATGRVQVATDAQLRVQALQAFYTAEELDKGVYVGDEFCIACHTWAGITRDTKHRQALRTPMGKNSLIAGKGVVADYDRNGVDDFMQGLDFNTISSVFDQWKPNAPILGYDAGTDTYTITIGTLTMPVAMTQGGTGYWKQRYLVRVPVTGTADGLSNENYVSPVQFNEDTSRYVLYHPEAWYTDSNAPRFAAGDPVTKIAAENGRTYSKKCIGCHTTGVRELYQDANGEWIYRPYPAALVNPATAEQYPDYDHDGINDLINIGCEACHGPGSKHVLAGGGEVGIVAPSKLDTDANNDLCEQCHVRVKSVPNKTHDWPYRDDTGTPWYPGSGETLADFYTDAAGLWPDGVHSKQHHQQNRDFELSGKPAFPFHPTKCIECHSAHSNRQRGQIRTSITDDGLRIPTSNDNNTLCLACHATHGPFEEITKEQVAELAENLDHIRDVTEAHTNHPYGPERSMGLSRCSECHMPKTAKTAEDHDIHAHTFEPIAPEKTLMYQAQGGMPNACAVSCHAQKVNSFGLGYDAKLGTWNEAFDVSLANALMKYFGPGGMWWDTEHAESMTKNAMATAAAPGEISGEVIVED